MNVNLKNLNFKDLALSFLKVLIVISIVFYIKKLNIPDNYKILIMILPTIIVLSFNNISNYYKYKGGNKPIILRRNDEESDKYLPDEFFIENFRNMNIDVNPNNFNENINISLLRNQGIDTKLKVNLEDLFIVSNSAQIHEIESPFWISKGYLDISNPNNFIHLNNLDLGSNYTIELWLRLKYVSNNNILTILNKNKILLEITYDSNFIYINKSNKIPMKDKNNWFQLVIMRGKYDTIGSNRGLIYINGIFNGYADNLPSLSNATNIFLFKFNGEPLDYNKNYNDLSNCSIIRIYNRSLSLDEIQNNYLKESYYYDLELSSDNDTDRTYVRDNALMFYLDTRNKEELIPEKPIIIKAPSQLNMNQPQRRLNWIQSAETLDVPKVKLNFDIEKQSDKQNTKETIQKKTRINTSKPVF